MSQQGSAGNVIAAIASFFIAGLGQLVQGRIFSALIFCVIIYTCYFFYFLIIPAIIGFLLHVWCVIDAAKYRAD
ncbi:MAG: TM2 domain-containing membrane protein YozV [Shewanella sp.]|jgi:TM2 domain-containing membrane protein YozV